MPWSSVKVRTSDWVSRQTPTSGSWSLPLGATLRPGLTSINLANESSGVGRSPGLSALSDARDFGRTKWFELGTIPSMNPVGLPRTLPCPVTIRRGEIELRATMVLVLNDSSNSWMESVSELLGETERKYFSTLRSGRRQVSYLLGRYAAKVALSTLLSEADLRAIEIGRGVFEQPIVRCSRSGGWDVTISHTEDLAVALAYPAGHPMGIDLERIDPRQHETILSQLSEREIGWLKLRSAEKLQFAGALWAAKESLSKVLRTGLMAHIRVYDLVEFNSIDSRVWEGFFENFAQYKVWVWTGSNHVLSIAFPKRSTLVLREQLFNIL
jgi:4'-phosphopantetheinyl transferase